MRDEYKNIDGVFINPDNLFVEWGDLMHVHNSNFKFAYNNLEFDYFVLHASNDLYVKYGVIDHFKKYKNGIFQNSLERVEEPTRSNILEIYKQDKALMNMMNYLNLKDLCFSWPEGCFFERKVFKQMIDVIDKFYVFGEGFKIAREESYYSTIVGAFVDKINTKSIVELKSCSRQNVEISKQYIDEVTSPEYQFRYYYEERTSIYAVKGFKRIYNDSAREYIRNLNS
ncbi:hypothetical protein D3C75_850040 [compost metagenome]